MSTSPSPLRREVSRVSRPVLVRLHGLPRPAFVLVLLGLVIAAALAPVPVAVPAAILVLLASGWLTYLSWPVLTNGARAVRVVILICLAMLTAGRYLG